jgi:histone demethylase JARID1
VPKGHWICDTCIIDTGRDYGFEEGHEHTFGSFFQRASSFRQKWLASRPPPPSSAPFGKDKLANEWRRELDIEDHLEREFWRLVESPHETVEVEYGADLHTTKGGR